MAVGVHGVLSGPAIDRLKGAPVSQIFVTNTTPIEEKLARLDKLRPLSVAPLLGEAVKRIHEDSSVSSLFV
jgi:ribose-phosphate pyrophosphokinase